MKGYIVVIKKRINNTDSISKPSLIHIYQGCRYFWHLLYVYTQYLTEVSTPLTFL